MVSNACSLAASLLVAVFSHAKHLAFTASVGIDSRTLNAPGPFFCSSPTTDRHAPNVQAATANPARISLNLIAFDPLVGENVRVFVEAPAPAVLPLVG